LATLEELGDREGRQRFRCTKRPEGTCLGRF